MNYIVTKDRSYFTKIGEYEYCNLEDMILPDIIAIDTETSSLRPILGDIFAIQIGTGENNYLIQCYDNNYHPKDVFPYLKDKILIGQNLNFDLGFFYKYDFYPEKVKDTFLASKILYNGIKEYRHGFGYIMERELGLIYDKSEQKNIHSIKLSTDKSIQYCFNDVDRLIELHEHLYNKIIEGGFKETYDLHCEYIKALAYMEQCGIPISSEEWNNKMNEDTKNQQNWKNQIQEYIYINIPKFRINQLNLFEERRDISVSITSSTQMVEVFNIFGINTKDKDNKDSIEEGIISKSKHEFVKMWLKFQEANHRVTTFGDKIYKKIENERLFTTFNPMVDTARLSTRKGEINFLNFSSDKQTRNCFKANKGNTIIVCDYEAQEGVILTDKSKDEAMKSSLLEGMDLHCLLTKAVFPELKDFSDDEIKKNHKDKRDICKVVRFLFSYGGNSYTLHMNEGFPLAEAVKIENSFKELHEGVYSWGAKVYEKSIKNGYIEASDGWKIFLPQYDIFKSLENKVKRISREEWMIYKEGKLDFKKKLDSKEKYEYKHPKSVEFYKANRANISSFFKLKSEYQRLSLNFPIQSCGSHMIKRATTILFKWIIDNNYLHKVLICNSIHDELLIECKEELKQEVIEAVEKSMKQGGNYYLEEFTLGATANAGNSWGEAK